MALSRKALAWRVAVTAVASGLLAVAGAPASAAAAGGATVVKIAPGAIGRPIPDGFVGLSMEYRGISAFTGDDPAAPNQVLIQLIRNLAPGQRPVLRIGGDSTDWSWWPVPGTQRPRWTRLTLDQHWVQVASTLTQALDARLILGINLEADNAKIAATMAQALIAGLGRSSVQALELGNEPELYASFGWYHTNAGKEIPGRRAGWSPQIYARDFAAIARALPGVPLAGPSTGSPTWMSQLGSFLAGQRRLGLVTLHRYPLKHCSTARVTASQLLSDMSTTGLANSVARYAALAHAHGLPLRIGEMNSIACGGAPGVSDTYASALWSLDALFEMARVGVDGVNIHTAPNAVNELFGFSHIGGVWQGYVHPVYYGLMTFAQAAPAGSRLLRTTSPRGGGLKVWATRARRPYPGRPDQQGPRPLPGGRPTVPAAAPATLELSGRQDRLQARDHPRWPGLRHEYDDGHAPGTDVRQELRATNGRYLIGLPPASAALLTL